ncbi:MAG: TetR/AcrR family transcriptional regulator [Proteobacteria bacterium]|nr:TetR/AcrR family transcriptional regulator [Pseudomonadota bacterium]
MKSYHHGNLKQELIDCACRLCERDGYTKLSIRSLAKESGVSQTAPYRHFETKETLYADKKITKKHLVEIGCNYIEFGLKNANTYDLMFGTAVGNFAEYPELLESANSTYENMRLSFSKLASDSDQVIAFKCITLWSMVHGLVGILRKVQVVGDDFEEGVGPISTASVIATNLEDHLDKVLTGLIQN